MSRAEAGCEGEICGDSRAVGYYFGWDCVRRTSWAVERADLGSVRCRKGPAEAVDGRDPGGSRLAPDFARAGVGEEFVEDLHGAHVQEWWVNNCAGKVALTPRAVS